MIYSIGHNLAGYSPETDPEWFADRDAATERLADVMREYADQADETAGEALPTDLETARAHGYAVADGVIDYGDDEPAMRATVDSILADDGPETGSGSWTAYAEDGRGRSIAFWIHAEDFDPEYTLVTLEGQRVSVEKTGGGTVGRSYSGYWRFVALDSDGGLIGCGNHYHTSLARKHADVAVDVLCLLEATDY